jgi:hypothetical protein
MPRPAKPTQPKCEVCRRLTATARVRLTAFGALTWVCTRCGKKKSR